jgi:hypothetical protein
VLDNNSERFKKNGVFIMGMANAYIEKKVNHHSLKEIRTWISQLDTSKDDKECIWIHVKSFVDKRP